MKEMRKRKEKKVAARKARDDWEALTASLREQMLVTENTENVEGKQNEENSTEIEIHEIQGVETKERENQEEMKRNDWVKEILYTQLEVTHMESSKRGLLIWAMQMEYAGQTFFDGYVLFSLFSDCVSLLQHRCFRVSGKRL